MKKAKELINRFLKNKMSKKDEDILRKFEMKQTSKNRDSVFKNDIEEKNMEDEMFSAIMDRIKTKRSLPWLKIAASIVVLIAVGYIFFNVNSRITYTEITNDTKKYMTINLEDGSKILLNVEGSIRYSDHFLNENREIELQGEAFFFVNRIIDKPFIVTTGDLKTEVLGTTFNVNETDGTIRVSVSSGLVKVYDGKQEVRLKPDQEAIYNQESNQLSKRDINAELVSSWYKDKIELSDITMGELGELFRSRYNTSLVFEDQELADKRLTIFINHTDDIRILIDRINFINEVNLSLDEQRNIILVRAVY